MNHKALRVIFLFLLSCCCAFTAIAQTKDMVLLGTIVLGDGQVYAYKLQFQDEQGKIKGFSITDINGPSETKATITGAINAARNEVKFTETKIIATKSNWNPKDFCYITGTIKLQPASSNVWQGRFTSYTIEKKPWVSGDIMLMGGAEILEGLNKVQQQSKSDTVTRLVNRLKAAIEDTTVKAAPPSIYRLSGGNTYEVQGNGKSAILEIWDDKIVDGDIVTITHNGKIILNSYTLQKEHKQLNVQLWGDTPDRITITANNNGSQPPNSAMVKLITGDDEYLINAETEPGKPAHILLKPLK